MKLASPVGITGTLGYVIGNEVILGDHRPEATDRHGAQDGCQSAFNIDL
jgi:hypothetical protein